MAFRSAADSAKVEASSREAVKGMLLEFGVSFLDDAMLGIRPDDLVLVGAPSGVGKTQFCVNIAMANVIKGKRVHFFALEASQFEVERRLKFQMVADLFYSDPDRAKLGRPLRYDEWAAGDFKGLLVEYEKTATAMCEEKLKTLFTFYKSGDFSVYNLIENFSLVRDETDLVIVDHVHYFDWDDSNDNRALKEIAKAARDICLQTKKPMVLV
jgi:KaiC/GvpD/RAD55 family RecA-like ATPase